VINKFKVGHSEKKKSTETYEPRMEIQLHFVFLKAVQKKCIMI